MSSTYSEDEFELTAGLSSAVSSATGPNTREGFDEEGEQETDGPNPQEGFDEEGEQETDEREGASSKLTVVLPQESVGEDAKADGSEAEYSSFEDDEATSLPLMSPSFTVNGERDGRTTKQKYLDLKRKTATVWDEANALAQRRIVENDQLSLQAQKMKESWHERIHRPPTELEWHRRVSAKTAQSAIDMALNREAWTRGVLSARAREIALDKAFCSAFGLLQVRTSEQDEAALAAERDRAEKRAAACQTVWHAARYGVPVRTLRELLETKIDLSRRKRHAQDEQEPSTNYDHSEPFEQLCRRVEGVVVESRHPYPKGVRQDVEAHVPNADCFYVAFDAASNATMGMGKVALQEFNASDPAVFFPRGPYNDSSGEARLPGVNGEPPMRVEGPSVLITFSSSYWPGVAPAGEDYGWRLVCFAAKDGDDAKASVDLADRAADRAGVVDAVNLTGETCLHVASFEGNVAAVRYLLSADANPNSAHTASGYNTPLHEAARSGSLAVTRLLLKSSANVLATNSHGDLPLHVACRQGRLDIARRLLAHDSDWATVVARNHAGLRPSEVVVGSSALTSLLVQAEVRAAEASKTNNAAAAAGRGGGGGTADASSPSLKTNYPLRRNSNLRRRGVSGALRRKTTGGITRSSPPEGSSARVLLSGSILPRWARLARPLTEEERRQRGPLDGRERRHHSPPQAGGAGTANNTDPTLSDCSEVQSFAGWSGTTYGASFTESDFEVPAAEMVGFPGDKADVAVGASAAARIGRGL